MKTSDPIILHIPDMLVEKLNTYLKEYPPTFKYDIMYFYYVVNYITIKYLRKKKDEEYICINKKYLRDVTTSSIGSYIKLLEEGGFIISDGKYLSGEKSLWYKLNPEYLKGNRCVIKVYPDTKLFKKTMQKLRNRKAHYNRLEPFLKAMKDEFMQVDLNYEEAYKWIGNNVEDANKLYHIVSLSQLKDKRFRYFKRNKTNKRLDTNLTNLKTELRYFIKGDYVNIDLKNSQPFFLSQLILNIIQTIRGLPLCCYLDGKKISSSFGIKALQKILLIHQNSKKSNMVNLRKFSNSVIKGTLYEDFVSYYPESIKRDRAKEIMFMVLFSQNTSDRKYRSFIPYEKEKIIFAEVFPFVYEVVKMLKPKKKHSLLAISLQRLESYIFIDLVAKRLVEDGIIPITIHDSVIVKATDEVKALEIMKNIFLANFGVIPTFKVEELGGMSNKSQS